MITPDNRLRILVVDDEQDILNSFQQILCPQKEAGANSSRMDELESRLFGKSQPQEASLRFDLSLCRNGEEALSAVQTAIEEQNPFAVAFIDVRMPPGPDGVTVAGRIRRIDPFMEIVIVTAYSDMDPKDIVRVAPPSDKLFYLRKPFHPEEIERFASALGTKWRTGEVSRKSAQFYLQAEEKAGIAPYLLNYITNQYDFLSSSIEELTGYRANEFTPELLDLITEEIVLLGEAKNLTLEEAKQRFHSEDGAGWRADCRIRAQNGEFRWLANVAVQVKDSLNNVIGEFGLFHDITQSRENATDGLQKSSAMYHDNLNFIASKFLLNFGKTASEILHEANAALTIIPLNSLSRPFLEKIEIAAMNAMTLTEEWGLYSGENTDLFQSFNLSSQIADISQFLDFCNLYGGNIEYALEKKLPLIYGSPMQINQLLTNLVLNACESLVEGRGDVTVRTGLMYADLEYLSACRLGENKSEGFFVFLDVSDQGCGMDDMTKSRLFEPYFSMKDACRGMGLCVVEGIVRRHQACIHIESDPAKGTSVRVLFPVKK
ncbi:MAG: ATP-binding protein [Candidatus Omnitrophota bacterium]